MKRILMVDNYDSFTYNVVHLFGGLGVEVDVLRNDDSRLTERAVREADGVVIGPGPGRPVDAGRTMESIAWAVEARRPVFGVCLGLQAIGAYFGGTVTYAPSLMHGKVSTVTHDGSGIFAHVPSPFSATRYHSLCVAYAPFPAELRVTAASEDGVVQGLVHRSLPIHAVQFHPESVLTPEGRAIAANFIASNA